MLGSNLVKGTLDRYIYITFYNQISMYMCNESINDHYSHQHIQCDILRKHKCIHKVYR